MNILPSNIQVLRFVLNKNTRCFYMPARKIKYLDLTFCLEGNMIYYINDKRVELYDGDAIIVPPNSIRMRYRAKTEIKYASFTVELPENTDCGEFRVIEGCVNGHIAYLLEHFLKEWCEKTDARLVKCNALFTYLYHLVEETRNKKQNPHVEKSKNIYLKTSFLRYLSLHLQKSFSLRLNIFARSSKIALAKPLSNI